MNEFVACESGVEAEVPSIGFDTGTKDHCKLAKPDPSAKPIIRGWEARSGERQLIYYEHLTSILQGGAREAALIY